MAACAAIACSGAGLPGPGEPAITAQTARTGGPVDPIEASVAFDSVDLAIEVLPDRERLEGVATLRLTAKQPISRLHIDLDRNLGPSGVAIDGRTLPASDFANPDGKLSIKLPRQVARGERISVEVRYGGTPHIALRPPYDSGAVWARTDKGQPWFGTTTEDHGCDLFWPCLDYPEGRPGLASLHITVPRGLSAPSNGRLISVDRLPDGRTTWNWLAKHPNTYGVALNVGPYRHLSGVYRSRYGNRIPLDYWYLPGEDEKARALFAEFAPALDFLERFVGPYPFGDEKVGVVETPYMGMEHQTINGYGFGYAKTDYGFDGLFFHELAHEWFANQLTAADWDDMWLHEGYASYLRPLYAMWRDGRARYLAIMLEQRDEIANKVPVVSGTPRSGSDLEDPVSGPGQDVYVKASWMLHTLRHLIGDRAFWEVTREAVYGRPDPKPGNFSPRYGSTAAYEGLVRKVTGRNLDWFFAVYLRHAQLPELQARRTGSRLTVSWKAPDNLPFPVPVDIAVDGAVRHLAMRGGRATIAVPAGAHVILDPDAWVLRHSDAAEAYYRWTQGRKAKAGSAAGSASGS